jgi:putative membrane protein
MLMPMFTTNKKKLNYKMNDEKTEKPSQTKDTKAVAVPPKQLAAEYLANERTFLAWVRTAIAVITLGFVVAKFGLWLGELALTSTQFARIRTGASIPVGIGMMLFGGLLVVLAAWRYHVVNRQIERGEVKADRGLIILVTVLVVVLSLVMVVYLLVAVKQL